MQRRQAVGAPLMYGFRPAWTTWLYGVGTPYCRPILITAPLIASSSSRLPASRSKYIEPRTSGFAAAAPRRKSSARRAAPAWRLQVGATRDQRRVDTGPRQQPAEEAAQAAAAHDRESRVAPQVTLRPAGAINRAPISAIPVGAQFIAPDNASRPNIHHARQRIAP